jgi:hypothetical protein
MSKKKPTSSTAPPQKKPDTSSGSVMLTNSEIAQLQQRKRDLGAYVLKAFASKK